MPGRRWVAAGLSRPGLGRRYAAGASPGEPWLARSRFGDLIMRPGRAMLAVRWETGGPDGEPFPCSTLTSP